MITVSHLFKKFKYKKSPKTFLGLFRSFLAPQTEEVVALHDLSFKIEKGERVAFVGRNGAGKSTTIKILTGILSPTGGRAEVLGLCPWRERKVLGYKIAAVFGQKSQLMWHHLPPQDSFDLLSKVYDVPKILYRQRLSELIEMFELASFLEKPIKNLSLGERMRCEVVAALLHAPEILFLDEPTIGLDVNSRLKMRRLLQRLSAAHKTTLLLTSHDTADIEQVCDRVLIIDQGSLIVDSSLETMRKEYGQGKIVTVALEKESSTFYAQGVDILENEKGRMVFRVGSKAPPLEQLISQLLLKEKIVDITIEETSLEEILSSIQGKCVATLFQNRDVAK